MTKTKKTGIFNSALAIGKLLFKYHQQVPLTYGWIWFVSFYFDHYCDCDNNDYDIVVVISKKEEK